MVPNIASRLPKLGSNFIQGVTLHKIKSDINLARTIGLNDSWGLDLMGLGAMSARLSSPFMAKEGLKSHLRSWPH